MKDNKRGKLHTIDPVELEIVNIGIRKAKLQEYVKYIVDYSTKAIPELKLEKIDFAMIDGDHNYESVKSDFETVRPLLRKGSVLMFHDTIWFDGPRRVIEEIKQTGQFETLTLPTPVGIDENEAAVLCETNPQKITPTGLSIVRKL